MSLREEQSRFAKDLCLLYDFLTQNGYEWTLGEAYRTKEQQQIYINNGLSRTWNSMHLKRLAQDLFIFKDGELIQDAESLRDIADYWEGIDEINRAGANGFRHSGTFIDTPHFERFCP